MRHGIMPSMTFQSCDHLDFEICPSTSSIVALVRNSQPSLKSLLRLSKHPNSQHEWYNSYCRCGFGNHIHPSSLESKKGVVASTMSPSNAYRWALQCVPEAAGLPYPYAMGKSIRYENFESDWVPNRYLICNHYSKDPFIISVFSTGTLSS